MNVILKLIAVAYLILVATADVNAGHRRHGSCGSGCSSGSCGSCPSGACQQGCPAGCPNGQCAGGVCVGDQCTDGSSQGKLDNSLNASIEAVDALDEVNAQRAARGLPAFQRDDKLTAGAVHVATYRAKYSIHGHTANDFGGLPVGAAASSAGCGVRQAHEPFAACCVYDHYRFAGAARVRDAAGRVFCQIFVR